MGIQYLRPNYTVSHHSKIAGWIPNCLSWNKFFR